MIKTLDCIENYHVMLVLLTFDKSDGLVDGDKIMVINKTGVKTKGFIPLLHVDHGYDVICMSSSCLFNLVVQLPRHLPPYSLPYLALSIAYNFISPGIFVNLNELGSHNFCKHPFIFKHGRHYTRWNKIGQKVV